MIKKLIAIGILAVIVYTIFFAGTASADPFHCDALPKTIYAYATCAP